MDADDEGMDLRASGAGLIVDTEVMDTDQEPPLEKRTEAPPPTPEEQRKNDSDFLSGIVKTFLQKHDKWSMSNIIPAFRAFAEKIHTYEARNDRPINANTFVALELMPSILYFTASKLFEELPESCRLVTDMQEEFVLSFMALFGGTSPRGASLIQNFEKLLCPRYDAMWVRVLHDDLALLLSSKAEAHLEHYSDGLADATTDAERRAYAEAYQEAHPDFDGQRLYEVASQHYPCGFNTFTEQRYAFFDMRYLLFPSKDILCARQITPETNAYLLRAAGELIDLEANRPDQDPALIEHLQKLLARGHPEGYTVVRDGGATPMEEF